VEEFQLGFLIGPSLSPVMKLRTPLTITLIPENHVDLSRSPFVGVGQFVQLCGLLSQYNISISTTASSSVRLFGFILSSFCLSGNDGTSSRASPTNRSAVPNHFGNSTANKPGPPAGPNPFIYCARSSALRRFFGSHAKRRPLTVKSCSGCSFPSPLAASRGRCL
jgi:hypothetical protein